MTNLRLIIYRCRDFCSVCKRRYDKNDCVMSKKERENKRSVILRKVLRHVQGKSFIRRNQARVHICSSCLALPPALRSRVWQPRVWQTSFRPVRHTRSYLSNYISRLSAASLSFCLSSPHTRRPLATLVFVRSLCFLLPRRKENRSIV